MYVLGFRDGDLEFCVINWVWSAGVLSCILGLGIGGF